MMSIVKDFKDFISRGNVVDMAVGIIIGASFTKIVNVLVSHILMPLIGFAVGGIDFADFKWTIRSAAENQEAVTVDYGLFINTIVDFFIVAISIFILIRLLNPIYRKRGLKEPETTTCPECTMKISSKAKRCPHCTSLF